MDNSRLVRRTLTAICVLCICSASAFAQQGLQLSGIGPVNRAMGGAATAAPLESIGALHWNPATIGALRSSELGVGVELFTPSGEVTSSFLGFTDTDESDSGWAPLPSIGFVMQPEESPFAFGMGVFATAGYILNYPASATNPVLFPQQPTPLTPFPGFGRVFGEAQFMQLAPAVSMQLSERLYIGAGPTVMLGKIAVDPGGLAIPDDANGNGFASFPDATGTRFHWGGGFQAGIYYEGETGWNFGASFKSPQWIEDFSYNSTDEFGLPRGFKFDLDYPSITSLGAAYTGFENLLIAVDVRYIDWANADGFGSGPGFKPNGALRGFGWRSIWTVGIGAQYQVMPGTFLRAGYAYNQSPITDKRAGFNVGAPLILQHFITVGLSTQLTKALTVHAGYVYSPEVEASGPLQGPAGPVPGSNVNYRISAHGANVGATVSF